jgi:hypothetical protein
MLVLWPLLAALAGCAAQPAQTEQMVAVAAETSKPLDLSLVRGICLEDVAGGKETNPLWTSQVGTGDLRTALELSLDSHGLLQRTSAPCPYRLFANLLDLKQPLVGFDSTVTSTVDYKLIARASGQSYMHETVTASYTASMSDAFYGVKRLQLANEGAIRENIRIFIHKLMQHPPAAPAS